MKNLYFTDDNKVVLVYTVKNLSKKRELLSNRCKDLDCIGKVNIINKNKFALETNIDRYEVGNNLDKINNIDNEVSKIF